MSTLTVRVRLNRAQARFMQAVAEAKQRRRTTYIDFEHAVRTGQSAVAAQQQSDLMEA